VALFEDMFKGNVVMTMAVGVGAAILAPVLVPALSQIVRPAAKAAIKGGYVLYQRGREQVAELGQLTEDIVAEARAELEEEGNGAALRAHGETEDGEGAVEERGELSLVRSTAAPVMMRHLGAKVRR
jgi:hypothetical protein